MIACGPIGERVALLARVRDVGDGRAVFVRQSPWRAVDTRSFPRFPTNVPAVLVVGDERINGTVVDVSLGGMAIEVEQPIEAESLDVRIGEDGEPSLLPCLVVSKQQRPDRTVLHVEFGILGDEAAVCVERLVADVSDGHERELLAS